MFFWLFVTLIVLLIAYRKQIGAHFNRSLGNFFAEVGEEARRRRIVSFDILIDDRGCPGIYDFLSRISSLRCYISMLLSLDAGVLDRRCIVDCNSIWGGRKNTDEEVKLIKLELDPEVDSMKIAKLESMAEAERSAYVTGLICDDIAYRKENEVTMYGCTA